MPGRQKFYDSPESSSEEDFGNSPEKPARKPAKATVPGGHSRTNEQQTRGPPLNDTAHGPNAGNYYNPPTAGPSAFPGSSNYPASPVVINTYLQPGMAHHNAWAQQAQLYGQGQGQQALPALPPPQFIGTNHQAGSKDPLRELLKQTQLELAESNAEIRRLRQGVAESRISEENQADLEEPEKIKKKRGKGGPSKQIKNKRGKDEPSDQNVDDRDDMIAYAARKFTIMHEPFPRPSCFTEPDPKVSVTDPSRYKDEESKDNGYISEMYRFIHKRLHRNLEYSTDFKKKFMGFSNDMRRSTMFKLRTTLAPYIWKDVEPRLYASANHENRGRSDLFVRRIQNPDFGKDNKEKRIDILKAPILYPNRKMRSQDLFRTKELALLLRGILFGPCAVADPLAKTQPGTIGKTWGIKYLTPGIVALGGLIMVFIHSMDKTLNPIGAQTNVCWSDAFDSLKQRMLEMLQSDEGDGHATLRFLNGIVFMGVNTKHYGGGSVPRPRKIRLTPDDSPVRSRVVPYHHVTDPEEDQEDAIPSWQEVNANPTSPSVRESPDRLSHITNRHHVRNAQIQLEEVSFDASQILIDAGIWNPLSPPVPHPVGKGKQSNYPRDAGDKSKAAVVETRRQTAAPPVHTVADDHSVDNNLQRAQAGATVDKGKGRAKPTMYEDYPSRSGTVTSHGDDVFNGAAVDRNSYQPRNLHTEHSTGGIQWTAAHDSDDNPGHQHFTPTRNYATSSQPNRQSSYRGGNGNHQDPDFHQPLAQPPKIHSRSTGSADHQRSRQSRAQEETNAKGYQDFSSPAKSVRPEAARRIPPLQFRTHHARNEDGDEDNQGDRFHLLNSAKPDSLPNHAATRTDPRHDRQVDENTGNGYHTSNLPQGNSGRYRPQTALRPDRQINNNHDSGYENFNSSPINTVQSAVHTPAAFHAHEAANNNADGYRSDGLQRSKLDMLAGYASEALAGLRHDRQGSHNANDRRYVSDQPCADTGRYGYDAQPALRQGRHIIDNNAYDGSHYESPTKSLQPAVRALPAPLLSSHRQGNNNSVNYGHQVSNHPPANQGRSTGMLPTLPQLANSSRYTAGSVAPARGIFQVNNNLNDNAGHHISNAPTTNLVGMPSGRMPTAPGYFDDQRQGFHPPPSKTARFADCPIGASGTSSSAINETLGAQGSQQPQAQTGRTSANPLPVDRSAQVIPKPQAQVGRKKANQAPPQAVPKSVARNQAQSITNAQTASQDPPLNQTSPVKLTIRVPATPKPKPKPKPTKAKAKTTQNEDAAGGTEAGEGQKAVRRSARNKG